VGLAAKEVASNIFGGAVIFLTRPFVIGEKIKVKNLLTLVSVPCHALQLTLFKNMLRNSVQLPFVHKIIAV